MLGVLLCGDHLRALGELFEARVTEAEDRLSGHFADVSTQWAGSVGEARGLVRAERERRDARVTWWVYYIRIGDVIKIGTTGDFRGRMASLVPDEVLAVEPGDMTVERERQRQFVHLRVKGERFRPEPDLLAHIQQVRELHGDPLMITRQPAA